MDKTAYDAADSLAEGLLKVLDDQKGLDTTRINLPPENAIASVMLITSATSRRHGQGISDAIEEFCSKNRIKISGREGYENANWILLDLSDILIHIFQPDFRDMYQLERLWGTPEEENR